MKWILRRRAAPLFQMGGEGGLKMAIGLENERTLHRELKLCFEPNPAFHEVKLGRFTADIFHEGGVVEVQTASLRPLRKRLAFFLQTYPVNVVYPIAVKKTICWIDPETGERSAPRKSPKKGMAAQILPELFWLLELLDEGQLTFTIALLDLEEHRLLCGWSRDRKRGSKRVERIPLESRGFVTLGSRADYRGLLPGGLPAVFAAKELERACGFSSRQTGAALKVLLNRGVIGRKGKRGNAFLYEILKES